jgi:hypothetical protein
VGVRAGGVTTAITFTPPADFVEIASVTTPSTSGRPCLWAGYKLAEDEGTDYTFTATVDAGTANHAQAYIFRVAGADAADFLAATTPSPSTGASVNPTSPSITTDANGAVVVSFVVANSGLDLAAADDNEPTGSTVGYLRTTNAGSSNGVISGYAFIDAPTAGVVSAAAWTGALSVAKGWGGISFAINPATVGGGFTITADSGSYALSGQANTMIAGGTISADQGSYSLLGSDGAVDVEMDAVQGAYTLTGQVADVEFPRTMSAVQGSYLLNGQNAGLSYSGAVIAAVEYIVRNVRRVMRRGWAHFGRY